jgi:hypothetical protein
MPTRADPEERETVGPPYHPKLTDGPPVQVPREVTESHDRIRLKAAAGLSAGALVCLPVFVIFLLAILLTVEGWEDNTVAALNRTAAAQAGKPADDPTLLRIDRTIALLGAADIQASGVAAEIRGLSGARSVPADTAQVLTECAAAVNASPAKPPDTILSVCQAGLRSLRARLQADCTDCSYRQIADLVKIIEEGRSGFRAHWLQIAQLVLLNLMLPLLTGLFGFLFGRESALNRKASDDS